MAERRHPPGRRGDDRELDYVLERLRTLEANFREDLARLGDEVDDIRDSAGEAGEALRRAIDQLRDTVDVRVRELEEFHIEDRALARERIAQELRRAQLIASAGSAAGAIGFALAVIEHFAHL